MKRALAISILLFALIGNSALAAPASTMPTTVPSRVTAVTVYRGSALVTREVAVPAGTHGVIEIVVSPLPVETIDNSLYSESGDGLRVMTTRYRTRAIRDDARDEVRAKEAQIKSLQLDAEKMQREVQVIEQNLQFLLRVENFTAATMQQITEKGLLSADTTIALSKYIMETRAERASAEVSVQQNIAANAEAQQFAQRELAEISAGKSRTERDAVIVIDKANDSASTLRLNYLVGAADWRPQYKLRAASETDPVQVEYLAAIEQQSGEDWSDAAIVLSTAEPMLNAAPPELSELDVTTIRLAGAVGESAAANLPSAGSLLDQMDRARKDRAAAKDLRSQASRSFNGGQYLEAQEKSNAAAALLQTDELLNAAAAPSTQPSGRFADRADHAEALEGPSVTYHLNSRFTVPSRNEEQLIEVARLQMKGTFFYKAVPVLTTHVYRLAEFTNDSPDVLLPGEATMYLGSDFVGRMNLPLVAIGEQFTAGFGVDPQLQVTRELITKSRIVQGGNQVHDFSYRIRVASFKSSPVTLQVWDRLPHAEAEAVNINLETAKPAISDDAYYVRAERPDGLLRWDLNVAPNINGEKSATVEYAFKMEYDRNVALGNFKTGQ